MKKVTWLLGFSLLLSGGSAFAEDVVSVGSTATFIEKMDAISSAGQLQKKVDSLTVVYNNEDLALRGLNQYSNTPIDNPGVSLYQAWYNSEQTEKLLYYKIVDKASNRAQDTIYISVDEYMGPEEKSSWQTLNSVSDYESTSAIVGLSNKGVFGIRFRYKDQSGNIRMSIILGIETINKNLSELTTKGQLFDLIPNGARLALPSYYSESDAYKNQKQKVEGIKDELEKAEGELKKVSSIKTLRLTSDLHFNAGQVKKWTLPAGYTINGNFCTIEGQGAADAALLVKNEGKIIDLVVSTGLIATTNTGSITNSIDRVFGEYRTYRDVDGKTTEGLKDLSEAAYILRNKYGFNFASNKIGQLDGVNKIYSAQYASPASKKLTSYKVNLTGNDVVTANNTTLSTTNTVVYIENTDASTDVENVAVRLSSPTQDGYEYKCQQTKLTDASNSEFYIPLPFKSQALTYDRAFDQAYATVCLPFALTATEKEALGIQYLHQFGGVTDKGFNFTWLDEVEANKPCLVKFKEDGDKTAMLSNIYKGELNFEATPNANALTDGKGFYGVYKKQTVGNLMNSHVGDVLYAIQITNGAAKFVRLTADNDEDMETLKAMTFDQFRGFVSVPSTDVDAPEYKMILLDEDGNDLEIATDVKTVSADKKFKAVGGNSAIEVSTDNACDVKVYSVNGTLVKSAHVEAGTTSLSVQAGVYVVNGVKVIVK